MVELAVCCGDRGVDEGWGRDAWLVYITQGSADGFQGGPPGWDTWCAGMLRTRGVLRSQYPSG
jgi:hypothetical protein